MRFRSDFLLATILTVISIGALRVLPRAEGGEPGDGWECGGQTNCMGDSCITQPPEGYSCAEVTPIDHPKCGAGSQDDCCETIQQDCARLVFYGAGSCSGDPLGCESNDDVGQATRQEDGCDPADDCVEPHPPGGTG